jgi:hypothetical protein
MLILLLPAAQTFKQQWTNNYGGGVGTPAGRTMQDTHAMCSYNKVGLYVLLYMTGWAGRMSRSSFQCCVVAWGHPQHLLGLRHLYIPLPLIRRYPATLPCSASSLAGCIAALHLLTQTVFLPQDNIVVGPITVPCTGVNNWGGSWGTTKCQTDEIYGWVGGWVGG